MTGKAHELFRGRPSTEPLYSGGSEEKFPIPFEYKKVDYCDFIGNQLMNNGHMLIYQNIYENTFWGIFDFHKTYKIKSKAWWTTQSYESLLEYIMEQWDYGKRIYSLVADDESGSFYVFVLEGYGDRQVIVKDLSKIKGNWDEGKSITSCTSRGSTYYIVMTDNVDGFRGQKQSYFCGSSWPNVEEEIKKKYKDRLIITSICYNLGLREYLVVMTKSSARQLYHKSSDSIESPKWMEEMYFKGYFPTIIFQDPNSDHLLAVATADTQRTSYTYRCNPLK